MKMTKVKLMKFAPCADGLAFAKCCDFDFVKIYETCPRGDWLLWLLRRTGHLTKPLAVEIAIGCAERVLPIYEKSNPKDKRPRLAIEAAINYLKCPSDANRELCKSGADAAYAAAAYADAAAAADAYVAYAATAARKSEIQWQTDFIRSKIPNPFTK